MHSCGGKIRPVSNVQEGANKFQRIRLLYKLRKQRDHGDHGAMRTMEQPQCQRLTQSTRVDGVKSRGKSRYKVGSIDLAYIPIKNQAMPLDSLEASKAALF